MENYQINYEALVFNFPITQKAEYPEHSFYVNKLTKVEEQKLLPDNNGFFANWTFLSCCFDVPGSGSTYVTLKNNSPIPYKSADIMSITTQKEIAGIVAQEINEFNKTIILETNLHIFFPVMQIKVYSDSNQLVFSFATASHGKIIPGCEYENKYISLKKRSHYHLNQKAFFNFLRESNHVRYKNAFDYYIRSFHETSPEIAFCLLCSAIDAITGIGKSGFTKERLAKYCAVLLCKPAKSGELKKRIKKLYQVRSNFVHGKNNTITESDEIELREIVRKFLISYFLFSQELGAKSEKQLLSILDSIQKDSSLYIKKAPASFSAITFLNEDDAHTESIMDIPFSDRTTAILQAFKIAMDLPPKNEN